MLFADTLPTPKKTAAPASIGVNRDLSASLRADFDALQNDLEQANAMTLELHCQLAGKSNDFAQLKHLFEKTTRDLAHLQTDIGALREERHRLANEAMRVTAVEFSLNVARQECGQLRNELVRVQKQHLEEVTRLQQELLALKTTALRRPTPVPQPHPAHKTSLQATALVDDIAQSLDKLREVLEIREKIIPAPPTLRPEPDFIAISYVA